MIVQFVIHIRLKFAYASFIFEAYRRNKSQTVASTKQPPMSATKKNKPKEERKKTHTNEIHTYYGAPFLRVIVVIELYPIVCYREYAIGINAHQNAKFLTTIHEYSF